MFMSDTNLPIELKPLSELIDVKPIEISPDLDEKLTENNQVLVSKSIMKIDHQTKTPTPFFSVDSLVSCIGTDRKPFRELMADAADGEVIKINDKYLIRSDLTKQFLQERSEQPRSCGERARIEATRSIVNEVGKLDYEQVIALLNNKVQGDE